MTKTIRTGVFLQQLHCALCLLSVAAMLVYRPLPPSWLKEALLPISLLLTCGCTLLPMGLTGAAMGIAGCIGHRRREGTWPERPEMLQVLLLPLLSAACWVAAVCIFVETTGGV